MYSMMKWISELPNLKNKIGIILAGQVDVNLSDHINTDYYVIAVDGGYDHLLTQNLSCDILIGDMDSISSLNYIGKQLRYDSVKDDTDFICALNHAKEYNTHADIEVFGYASLNRIDHVLGNLSAITENVKFVSQNQQIIVLESDTLIVADEFKYYSFFALSPVQQFSLTGFKYPLVNYQLNPFDPLCVSNELSFNNAKVEISNGRVICIKSKFN